MPLFSSLLVAMAEFLELEAVLELLDFFAEGRQRDAHLLLAHRRHQLERNEERC